MIRALAMLSYVYQSASALVLIVCLSRLLSAEVYIGASPRDALLLAAVGTALTCLCAAGPTLAYGAVPKGLVTGASVIGAALIGATALHTDAGLVWLVARIALSAAIVAGIAWAGDFLQMRGERPCTGETRPPVPSTASPPSRRGQGAEGDVARISRRRRAERSQA